MFELGISDSFFLHFFFLISFRWNSDRIPNQLMPLFLVEFYVADPRSNESFKKIEISRRFKMTWKVNNVFTDENYAQSISHFILYLFLLLLVTERSEHYEHILKWMCCAVVWLWSPSQCFFFVFSYKLHFRTWSPNISI